MSEELLEQIDRPEAEPFTAPEPVAEPAAVEEPAPTEAKTPEPAAAEAAPTAPAAAVPAPAKEPERVVPLATLLEERRRYEARLRELENKPAAPAPAKTAPEPEIDYTQDPKGYVDSKVQKALHELEQLKKEGTETIGQTREQVSEIQLNAGINAAEAAIAAETPDYQQALAHVRNVRIQQLQLINPDATAEQLIQHLSQEERAMAASELARGRNPYALLYQVAKTFGYTGPAAKPAAPALPAAAVKPNGATPTLSPDLTLGKSGGSAPDTAQADDGEEEDILTAAFSERFGRKRA